MASRIQNHPWRNPLLAVAVVTGLGAVAMATLALLRHYNVGSMPSKGLSIGLATGSAGVSIVAACAASRLRRSAGTPLGHGPRPLQGGGRAAAGLSRLEERTATLVSDLFDGEKRGEATARLEQLDRRMAHERVGNALTSQLMQLRQLSEQLRAGPTRGQEQLDWLIALVNADDEPDAELALMRRIVIHRVLESTHAGSTSLVWIDKVTDAELLRVLGHLNAQGLIFSS
jgi:hypothetical protein